MALLAGCGAASAVASCTYSGQTCLAPNETRLVGGVSVTRECWQYQRHYTCVEPDNFDNCAAIAGTAGCRQTSAVCTATSAIDGSCLTYTMEYRCADAAASVATGVVVLPSSYTITSDAANLAACAAYENNPTCKQSAQTCTEGPETRTINGLAVYKDCWAWKYDYTCKDTSSTSAYDNCAAIAATPKCAVQSSTCTATSTVDGSCSETTKTYLCADAVTPLPTQVVLLNTSYTIVGDTLDTSACTAMEMNPLCTPSSSVCSEGPATKIINGLAVYKDCWQYTYTYVCTAATPASDCGDLVADPKCTIESSTPARTDTGAVDPYVTVNTYKCETVAGSSTTATVCTPGTCVAGVCPPAAEPPNDEFAVALTSMEATREAANYKDGSGLFFTGNRNECRGNGAVGIRRCCEQKVRSGGDNSALGKMALTFAYQAVKYFGTTYVFDPISGWLQSIGIAVSQAYQAAVGNTAASAGATTGAEAAQAASTNSTVTTADTTTSVISQSGSTVPVSGFNFGVYGFTFSYSSAAGFTYVGFDPVTFWISVAIQVYQSLSSCSQDETTLSMRRGQGLCATIGTYTTGSNLTRTVNQAYCCYNSKLARIINEQGRPQISKPFGSPQSETCQGFTEAELASLDFSKMDFSEFFADLTSTPQDQAAIVSRFKDKSQQLKDNYTRTGTGVANDAYTIPQQKP